MPCKLNWNRQAGICSFHALASIASGQTLVDEVLQAKLEPLRSRINGMMLPPNLFQHLVPLSGINRSDKELAEIAVRKTYGSGPHAPATATSLLDVIRQTKEAFGSSVSDIEKQLMLRTDPIQQQWLARGPGLLSAISRLTDEVLIPESAEVFVVFPVLGGGGEAHLPYNSVRIEGVLADPHDSLPEALRLGWLIAQLNLDIPIFSDRINGRRLPTVAKLAVLPATLAAAETVELGSYSVENLEAAMNAWNLDSSLASVVDQWWQAYQASRPKMAIAIAGLDKMLPAEIGRPTPISLS